MDDFLTEIQCEERPYTYDAEADEDIRREEDMPQSDEGSETLEESRRRLL